MVYLLNLLRCALGKEETALTEQFQMSVRDCRKKFPSTELMLVDFDWHDTLKQLGLDQSIQGMWARLGGPIRTIGVARGKVG